MQALGLTHFRGQRTSETNKILQAAQGRSVQYLLSLDSTLTRAILDSREPGTDASKQTVPGSLDALGLPRRGAERPQGTP